MNAQNEKCVLYSSNVHPPTPTLPLPFIPDDEHIHVVEAAQPLYSISCISLCASILMFGQPS